MCHIINYDTLSSCLEIQVYHEFKIYSSFATLPDDGRNGSGKDNTKVIAHRGYWKTEGSAQNSIRSLERASEIGAYGSEFDVHLTADNVLVVYHDNDIQGKHIQSCTYDELKDLQLSNGEKLPTLEQYLKRAKKLKNIRLIFELKSHDTPERNRDAARLSVQW